MSERWNIGKKVLMELAEEKKWGGKEVTLERSGSQKECRISVSPCSRLKELTWYH